MSLKRRVLDLESYSNIWIFLVFTLKVPDANNGIIAICLIKKKQTSADWIGIELSVFLATV